jgi:hypothetical protein
MASYVCKACKEPIDRVATCPHCGERVPRAWELPLIAGGIVVAVTGVGLFLATTVFKEAPPPAPQTAEERQAAIADRAMHDDNLLRVCAFRKTQKAAETFAVVKVVRLADDSLCLHFTVKNSFGSNVSERWTLPAGDNAQPQRTNSCDNLAGRDGTAAVAHRLQYCPG